MLKDGDEHFLQLGPIMDDYSWEDRVTVLPVLLVTMKSASLVAVGPERERVITWRISFQKLRGGALQWLSRI